jgi:phosphatidylglycerol:prolipoprotein diacylglycerol transferase
MKDFIAFPALGLEFKISNTIVQFELFSIQVSLKWYGLLIALGFLLAVIYAMRRVKDFDINPDAMIDVVLVCALFAFIGARIYYVLFSEDRSSYFSNPLSILKVWEGGLAIYGGIIFAFATAIWMCRLRKVNTLAMFDIGSLGFLIGQAVGRWGNFFNQEAFGTNTSLPWGMTGSIIQQGYSLKYDTSLPVHPTFLYESLWCALGFLLLHLFSKKAYKFKGQIFALYIIWYGAGRFVIEGLRADSLMIGAALRVSQVVAGMSVLGGVAFYFYLRAKHNSLPVDLFETATADGETAETEIADGETGDVGETEPEETPVATDGETPANGEAPADGGPATDTEAPEAAANDSADAESEKKPEHTDAAPEDEPAQNPNSGATENE